MNLIHVTILLFSCLDSIASHSSQELGVFGFLQLALQLVSADLILGYVVI